jgi:hypothetical protein
MFRYGLHVTLIKLTININDRCAYVHSTLLLVIANHLYVNKQVMRLSI